MSQLLEEPRSPVEQVDRLPSLLRPLRNRNYALLFTGQLCSLVGDQLYVVALPFLVLGHASVSQLGLALMCFGLARIAALPLGGILADRMDRARLMLLSDIGRAGCVAAIAGVVFLPGHPMLPVMALTAVLGALEGLFLPPSYAILPDVLSEDELPAGNALNTALESAAAFVGPAIAGLVLVLFTPGVALAIDAVTFIVSAGTLLALRPNPNAAAATGADDEADADDAGASRMRFVDLIRVSRVFQLVLLITLFSNLAFDAMADVALPVFSRDELSRGAEGFGVMLSAFGVGALVGALLSNAFFRVPRRGLVALGMGVVQGIAIVLVPLFGGIVGACALLATAGATVGILNTFYVTQVQEHVPSHVLGRAMGALTMAVFGAQPVSVLAAGLVLGGTSVAPIFATAGLLIVAGYLLALPSAEFRRL
jgi:predicted MFS family arabinose efflux permease